MRPLFYIYYLFFLLKKHKKIGNRRQEKETKSKNSTKPKTKIWCKKKNNLVQKKIDQYKKKIHRVKNTQNNTIQQLKNSTKWKSGKSGVKK